MRCAQLDIQEQNDVEFQFEPIYTQMSCTSHLNILHLEKSRQNILHQVCHVLKAKVVRIPPILAHDSSREIYLKTNSAEVYHIRTYPCRTEVELYKWLLP